MATTSRNSHPAVDEPTGPQRIFVRTARRICDAARRFAGRNEGASAVEFALIAPVFLFTVFIVFETITVYWADRVLQMHASDLARRYRTGYVATVDDKDASGKPIKRQEDLCRDRVANLLFNCTKIMVDIRETSKVPPLKRKDGKIDATGFAIDPGDAGSVNVVRVFYDWDRMFGVPIVPAGDPVPDGNVELYAASAFVTE